MKKQRFVIIGILMALLVVPSLKAQESKIGVRAGWQSSLLNSDGNKSDKLSSFYAGVFKENKLIPLIHLGYGLEYSQMGGAYDLLDYKLGYLGVPVYAKAKVGPLYGLVGSGINFKISETDLGDGEDNAKGIDVPVYAGVGFNFLMLSIEARYHWGMIEIQDKTKNQYLQLGVAARF
nr:outer membrane beta-barrel protein [uncultured Carboxylicivirga sp.]